MDNTPQFEPQEAIVEIGAYDSRHLSLLQMDDEFPKLPPGLDALIDRKTHMLTQPLDTMIEHANDEIRAWETQVDADAIEQYRKARSFQLISLYPNSELVAVILSDGVIKHVDKTDAGHLLDVLFEQQILPDIVHELEGINEASPDEILALLCKDVLLCREKEPLQIWFDTVSRAMDSELIQVVDLATTTNRSLYAGPRDRIAESQAFRALYEREGNAYDCKQTIDFVQSLLRLAHRQPERLVERSRDWHAQLVRARSDDRQACESVTDVAGSIGLFKPYEEDHYYTEAAEKVLASLEDEDYSAFLIALQEFKKMVWPEEEAQQPAPLQ